MNPTPTPTATPAIPPARALAWRTALAGGVLGVVFTLFCVQWSLAHGRLSQDPTYDDSFYLWEGAHTLDGFFRYGLGAFLADLIRHPPHSPFSTLGAAAAFAVCGVRDWAPYALVNGGVLLALLACVAYLARAFDLRWRLLSMGLVLTLPLAVVAVHDFRPDFACALLTAASVYLMAEAAGLPADHDNPAVPRGRWAAAGVGFGLALVVKPSFFLHTLLMEGLAWGVFVCLRAGFARPFSWPAILHEARRALAWTVLPSLLVAAPYYVVNAHETYQYFVDRSMGQHGSIWRVPGGVSGLIWYNTFGLAGTTMLGETFFVGLMPYLMAVAWLAWRRRGQELATQTLLLAVGCVSIAVMVVGKLPNPFFPLTCFLLIVFVAWRAVFTALADFLPLAAPRRWPGAVVAAVLLLAGVLNVSFLHFERIWIHDNPSVRALVGRGQSYNARLLADMDRELGVGAARVTSPLPVFLTTAGFISGTTLSWLAERDGLPFEFFDHQLSNSLDEQRQGIRAATFVIAPEDHTAGVFQELPSWTLRAQVAQALAAEVAAGRLRLLRTYPTQDGGAYQLFVRDEKTAEWVNGFSAVAAWDGFLPVEGPYPKTHLGQVRWATGAHPRVTLAPEPPGPARLRFSVRADQPVHASVSLDGVAVATVDLPGQTGFHDYRVPVTLPADAAQLTFDFDPPPHASPDGVARALLFRQLDLQPAP